MIYIPIWDYFCNDCSQVFESIEIWESHKATKCKLCGSPNIEKIIGSRITVRMDPNSILKSMPDPTPPLEELRGKNKPGCEGGYKDKPQADTQLKNYIRKRDKYGNAIWEEKHRQYIDMGKKR